LSWLAEARAKQRFKREQAEHDAGLAQRATKAVSTGEKATGLEPKPPLETPLATDQMNLTDEEYRIMPVADGSFEQCYKQPGDGGCRGRAGTR
jgi:hypothetical protein